MEKETTVVATFHNLTAARAAARELEHSGVKPEDVSIEAEGDRSVLHAAVPADLTDSLPAMLNGAEAVELDPDTGRFVDPRPGPNRDFNRLDSKWEDASLGDTEMADDPLLPGESRKAKIDS